MGDDLDTLAGDLRDRLAAEPDGDDDLTERIRALVDREAAVLDDPVVEEDVVCNTAPGGLSAAADRARHASRTRVTE